MEIVFIRHGEPAWISGGKPSFDPELTEKGRKQAQHVADRLSESRRPFHEIIVSPAVRAKQTAEPIAEALSLEPVVIDELVEIKLPDWRGHPPEKIRKSFQEARSRPPRGWWEGLPGGESFTDFHQRIRAAMSSLLEERGVRPDPDHSEHGYDFGDEDLRIIVVAHGGTNAVALGCLLGIEPTPWEWERLALGHAAIAKLRAVQLGHGFVFSLRAFNDLEHLPRSLRSG